jgi:CHASE2 domain-containing sensor protein
MGGYKIGPEGRMDYRAIVFIVALVSGLGFGQLVSHGGLPTPELKAEDAIAKLAVRQARPDVVLLALDNASVSKYGPVKSWPRSLLAAGLSRSEKGKPKEVIIDLALDKRTKTGDSDLWRAMANNRNVVLGMSYNGARGSVYTPDDIRSLVFLEKYALADKITFTTNTQSFPYYLFQPPVSDYAGSSRGVGVFDRETDTDGVLRSSRLFYISTVAYPSSTAPLKGKFPQSVLADGTPVALPNITLVAAQRAFDLDKEDVQAVAGNTVRLLGTLNPPVVAPVDDQGRTLIRFYGPAGHYPTVSFVDLISGKVDPKVFKDKIVLIGATAAGDAATDARLTPMGSMPRVEITANSLATFLDRSFLGRYSYRLFGAMILVGLVVGLALMFVAAGRATAITFLLLVAYTWLCFGLRAYGHILLPVLPGIVTILITYLTGLILYLGPMKPIEMKASETYVPPPAHAVR